ncbi:MAG: SLBB domain-containing protein [Candidatus Dormibacteraeota bacterium]|nr:SLBB domain-containing protein [Candidatus Dormibacteraeota bacterium]
MIASAATARLLDGPAIDAGAESFMAHRNRLGPLPRFVRGRLIDVVEEAGLRGRGGGAYPTARKWAATRGRSGGRAVVVGNGAETEPMSLKDRTLMAGRPQLVLDGILLAAEAVSAERAVLYVSRAHDDAAAAVSRAIDERDAAGELAVPVTVVRAPHRYVAGEETAAIAHLNGGAARPSVVPPRPFERGVDGRPTVIQNIETLAHAALIARTGAEAYRSAGVDDATGTVLVTMAGAVHSAGVYELAGGSTIAQAVSAAGGATASVAAILVGGYFGRWVTADDGWDLRPGIDLPLGSGVVAVFPHGHCGLAQAAALVGFLARESARQCGPCKHGLAALASTASQLAAGGAKPRDAECLQRWIAQIAGRGACHHPDGALVLLASALRVFSGDVSTHLRRGRCDRNPALLLPAPDWTRKGR